MYIVYRKSNVTSLVAISEYYKGFKIVLKIKYLRSVSMAKLVNRDITIAKTMRHSDTTKSGNCYRSFSGTNKCS